MGLSSAGIGSNLDVEGIVTKLMSVEQQPLALLQKKETSYQAKLSGFGTLKGALSSFQTAVQGLSDITKFQGVRASAADPTIATASGDATAVPGTYALKVSQLAQAQKLVATGTASQLTAISTGTISFDFGTVTGAAFASAGGGVKTVTIDSTNNSLAGIRDAINKAGVGVTATIVNDGTATPYRLALTSNSTGAASSMKITVADTGSGDLGRLLTNDPAGATLTQTAAAQDAKFTIDGIDVSKPSNTVKDVIGGVTLNLLKENPVTATNVTVSRDTAAVTSAVNGFVKAYNDISQTLRDAAAYNSSTKTAAILNGEASVRTIQSQIRGVLTAPVAGGASAFSRLSEVGVTLQKDGLLAVDSTKLASAIDGHFSDLAGLFAAAGKSSNSLAAYSSASSATLPGAYAVTVSQVATKGFATATPAISTIIDASNDTFAVMLNGVTSSITLGHANYTAAQLAAELQSKINGAASFSGAGSAVAVTESGGVLSLTSNRYGSASNVSMSQSGAGPAVFSAASVTPGLDVAGTINGASATGNGQLLTGATGNDAAGLAVNISGGVPGPFGTVNYSQGYAYQFNKIATGLLSATGLLASRTDGIAASIKALTKNEADLTTRLAVTEKRYRAQFTALDLTISKMNTTSTFLTQQLAQISGLSSQ